MHGMLTVGREGSQQRYSKGTESSRGRCVVVCVCRMVVDGTLRIALPQSLTSA
jgi:hypothetical protein